MAVLCSFLAAACAFDYGRNKIPNFLVVIAATAGAGRGYFETGPGGAVGFLAKAVGIMLLLYPFFRVGMLGAGDVKLLGVSSGYFQGKEILTFLFISMLIAAIISVFHVLVERNARERLEYFLEYCRDVVCTGNWRLYFSDRNRIFAGICLSGPVFCSALLHWGGVY